MCLRLCLYLVNIEQERVDAFPCKQERPIDVALSLETQTDIHIYLTVGTWPSVVVVVILLLKHDVGNVAVKLSVRTF